MLPLVFFLMLQTELPGPDSTFMKELTKRREIVDWLITYDHVAWKTSDMAMAEEGIAKRLGKEWFCLETGGVWYGVYGRYDSSKDSYEVVRAYEMTETGEAVASNQAMDPVQMNAYGSAIFHALPKLHDIVGEDAPRHNTYVRRMPNQEIEVWFIPAIQTNGVYVYGGDFRFVFDAQGNDLQNSQHTYSEYKGVRAGAELELDDSDREVPTVGSLFFLLYYHKNFKDLSIRSKEITTRVIDAGGHKSLVHIQHSSLIGPWLETETGCRVASLGRSKSGTAVWDGACEEGYAHGPGMLTITAGKKTITWNGGLKAGLPHGKGIEKTIRGELRCVYENGKKQGEAVYISARGDQFSGPFHQDQDYGWWRKQSDDDSHDYYRYKSRLAGYIQDLSWAAQSNNPHLAAKSLASGALINAYNADGSTPLLEAVFAGHHEMVSQLLKKGANPNLAHRTTGETALVMTRKYKTRRIAGLLLTHGAIFDPSKGKTFPQAIEALPDRGDLWSRKAKAWQQVGEKSRALFCAKSAVEHAPKRVQLLWDLGNLQHDNGYFDRAVDTFDKALALKEIARIWNDRGFSLDRLQRNDEALESYAKAAALDADDYLPWVNRAGVLHRLNRFEEALADLEQALLRKPDHASAINGKAIMLGELKRYDEALVQVERAIKMDPRAKGYKQTREWLQEQKATKNKTPAQ